MAPVERLIGQPAILSAEQNRRRSVRHPLGDLVGNFSRPFVAASSGSSARGGADHERRVSERLVERLVEGARLDEIERAVRWDGF